MTAAGWSWLGATPWAWAGLGVVLAATVVGWATTTAGMSPARRTALLALRIVAVALAAVAVLRPAREVDLTRVRRDPLVVVVDDSRSMALGDPAPGDEARRWLEQTAQRFDDLERLYRLERVGLGDPPSALGGDEPLFTKETSPLGRTLESVARTRPGVAGVVLLTDGRDTERPGIPSEGLPYPVYPVVLAGEPPPDLWIERVETPPVGFIRNPVEVRVDLGMTGLAPGPVVVTLVRDGRPVTSAEVELSVGRTETSLTFTPTRTGRHGYRVEVTPRPGEVTGVNNAARFTLQVIRDKTRVLLVAGTPTWDVKALRRRLRQDLGVDLITFLILRTPQDLSLVPQDELSLIPFPTRELFSQELPSFDVVIFANFDYGPYVPRQYLDNLVRFVRESGGGFAMVGGDRSFAMGGYVGSPLEAIVPLDMGGAAPGRSYLPGRFRPRWTEAGRVHPLFHWLPDPIDAEALWMKLPPLDGMNWVLRPRPDAVVLLENPERRTEYGPMPVVALSEVGEGRTLAVATDSLWRWGLPHEGAGGAGRPYRDFWGRALRWLVHDPDMELVRLAPPPGDVRAGSLLEVRARVLDPAYHLARGAKLAGDIVGEGGQPRSMVWEEVAPGEYRSQPVALPSPGLWRIDVEGTLKGRALGRDALELPVAPPSPEPLRVGVDRVYLSRLAEGSGGRLVEGDPGAWFDALEQKGRARVEVVGRRVEELWPTDWLFALAVGLLCLDWWARRAWS